MWAAGAILQGGGAFVPELMRCAGSKRRGLRRQVFEGVASREARSMGLENATRGTRARWTFKLKVCGRLERLGLKVVNSRDVAGCGHVSSSDRYAADQSVS